MRPSRKQARFWDKLIQSIEERRVVPILGQDLLTLRVDGREALAYAHLAERLAEYLEVPGGDLPRGGELNAVACRFLEDTGGQDLEDIYSGLKSIWAAIDELPVPAPLIKLAEIEPLELFVTTTFDPFLERALNQVRSAGREATRVLAYSPNSATDLDSGLGHRGPTVFHLFGKLSTVPDFAVTDEDFLEFIPALYSETRRPNGLFDELERRQLLIIGCSYPNWLARFFIRAAAGDRLSAARGRSFVFAADELVREDARLVDFLEHFGAGTRLFAGGGSVAFVDQLHEQWTERHPPGTLAAATAAETSAAAAEMEPGAVFLSYASEDLAAAAAVRESLAQAGMDVWFDKTELEPGDAFENKIRRNIESCSVFVPIISSHTLTSRRRYFRKEWRHAESVAEMAVSAERFIVPVAIDDTLPDAEALPESLRTLHWARLPEGRASEQFVHHIRQLVRDYHKARQGVRT